MNARYVSGSALIAATRMSFGVTTLATLGMTANAVAHAAPPNPPSVLVPGTAADNAGSQRPSDKSSPLSAQNRLPLPTAAAGGLLTLGAVGVIALRRRRTLARALS